MKYRGLSLALNVRRVRGCVIDLGTVIGNYVNLRLIVIVSHGIQLNLC
jgi:hypothetical protein